MSSVVLAVPDFSTHVWWYLGRSSGFVSYWLLFASVALGLAISSRFFDGWIGRPWVFEMHKFLSIFVLLAMTFHALIMLPDPYAGFSLKDLLVPMQSQYRTVPMTLGIVTLYGSLLITASFYLKGLLGQKAWRLVHYATFGLFVTALAHGVWTGTDSGAVAVQFMYLGSALGVLFLTFFRILAARSVAAREKRAVAPVPRTAQAA
jgi:predicted ferric reductase